MISERCLDGHDWGRDPTKNPILGNVPSASSTVIGVSVVITVLVALLFFLPHWVWLAIAVLAFGGFASFVCQFSMGHRNGCLLRRWIRWWFGPLGISIDPFGAG